MAQNADKRFLRLAMHVPDNESGDELLGDRLLGSGPRETFRKAEARFLRLCHQAWR